MQTLLLHLVPSSSSASQFPLSLGAGHLNLKAFVRNKFILGHLDTLMGAEIERVTSLQWMLFAFFFFNESLLQT